jgi:predicted nucleic-acid-binding protein
LTGLDTNVLVRFFTTDDPKQFVKAKGLIDSLTKEDPGWIAITTIIELVWVIASRSRGDRKTMTAILGELLAREDIVVEQGSIVESAFQRYRDGKADFADCLIAASARAAGCSRTVTFDRIAARDAGMELIG